MVCRFSGSRCQSHAERRYMPFGILFRQNSIGLPRMRCSMPRCEAWAEIANPKGPAPIISRSVSLFKLLPTVAPRMLLAERHNPYEPCSTLLEPVPVGRGDRICERD